MSGKLALLGTSIAALAALGLWRDGDGGKASKSNPMVELRRKVLTEAPSLYGLKVTAGDPWAVIMEMGFPKGAASLVCLVDGNASLYLTTGGGVIGGFAHEKVRMASIAFVQMAKGYRHQFSAVKAFPLPVEGRTIFYVRVDGALLRAEASENDLGEGKHPLSNLFFAGQEVIRQLQSVSELRK
jgi:hypothetical protein